MQRSTRLVVPLAVAVLFTLTCASAQTTPGRTPDTTTPSPAACLRGHLIVKMKPVVAGKAMRPGLLSAGIASVVRAYDVRTIRSPFASHAEARADRHGLGRVVEIAYGADIDPTALARLVMATGEAEYAEPIRARRISGGPSDTLYARQYALRVIQAEGAWGITKGDSTVVIAIIDTGVDTEHPDLAANIWTNPGEVPDNGIDDDGNGKVDDLHGWDFVGDVTMIEALDGIFREDNDARVRDLIESDPREHGTHVAGIAAAVTDNVTGIAGIAPNCRILPVKCASDKSGDQVFRGYEAIVYAARTGASVINCSWGSATHMRVEADAVAEALDLGATVVVSAGNETENNDRFDRYPANLPGVISVGAVGRRGSLLDLSSYGTVVSVFAPGEDILSTVANQGYLARSGTSMASPIVAGVAALVRSVHKDWTPAQVASQIRSTCDAMGDSIDRQRTIGRVNARRAVSTNLNEGAPQVPGIEVTRVRALASTDTITSRSPVRLALTLRNNLGTARSLVARIAPADGETTILAGDVHTIDSLEPNEEWVIELELRPTGQDLWFSGLAALRLHFEAENYFDYAMVQIPFTYPSRNGYSDLGQSVGLDLDARDISAPSVDVAWVIGWLPGDVERLVRVVNGVVTWTDLPRQWLNQMHGIDSLRCVIASWQRVHFTEDGGRTWQDRSPPGRAVSIGRLFVSDEDNWASVSPNIEGTVKIIRTTDGGSTWRSDSVRLPQGVSTLMPDRHARLGNSAWHTTRGILLRTTDGFRTWKTSVLSDSANVMNIAFTTADSGIAMLYGRNRSTIVATTDGGATWSSVGPFDPAWNLYSLSATPSGRYVLFGSDGSVRRSIDGRDWTVIPSRKLRTRVDASVSIANDSLLRVWHRGPIIGHLDIPLPVPSAVRHEALPAWTQTLSILPNPTTGEIIIDLSGMRGATRISVHDLLGRVMLTSLHTGAERASLDLSGLDAGSYLIVARDGETVRAARLVRR